MSTHIDFPNPGEHKPAFRLFIGALGGSADYGKRLADGDMPSASSISQTGDAQREGAG